MYVVYHDVESFRGNNSDFSKSRSKIPSKMWTILVVESDSLLG